MNIKVSAGFPYPLGATVTSDGVNFALFSANAEKVELCLFDSEGEKELIKIEMPEFTDDIWHVCIEGIEAGALYGYRVHGPFEPHNGHRFNPSKLLLDPYAKALLGEFVEHKANYSYDLDSCQKDLTLDYQNNAAYMPKCVVTNELEALGEKPQIRRRDTIIYEMHVKGFTRLNQAVSEKLRGTYLGLADDASIDYLKALGITSVELLPVHQFIDEPFTKEKGLANYWGYNSINFFAPDARYALGDGIEEFREMVNKLHQAGIEVILDVVYNHSAEGNELGPTFCFKGIDNASYYRLTKHDKRFYENFSGCGNTFNIDHPRVLQMVTDSLRYWVQTMGVDGFRFDLASILGRERPHFNQYNHFFNTIKQDPILAGVKLIAEPWDIGQDGYQLGRFPNSWMEWNDRFRDTVRRFWRGDHGMLADFANRIHGSSDLFENRSRRPSSSINFITSHDGYTLCDLVSYQEKHNHANGENNKDGHNANYSCNFGVEGETADTEVNALRLQQQKNILTTLFISQGTPMLLSGDEFGHSQKGNNNAYCQDNETSWLSWQKAHNSELLNFVQELIELRKAHPLLNRTHYHHGDNYSAKTGLADISWLNCHGKPMQDGQWHDHNIKCFAMLLANTEHELSSDDFYHDDALLVIFNAHDHEHLYHLPKLNGYWQTIFNTADTNTKQNENLARTELMVSPHSCCLLSFSQSPAEFIQENETYELN